MMQNGPVVIGGIGGSGTRVVAEIIALFGFYLGKDLNGASDNLTYTLLFKRPKWFRQHYLDTEKIFTGLRIFEKSMISGEKLTLGEKLFLYRARKEMSKYGHNREGEGKGDWPEQRCPFIRKPLLPEAGQYVGWGFKEPNSHMLIPMFDAYFPRFRYIHTVRHGLDMAYSTNQQQLFNWGTLFGVELPEHAGDIPQASFRYWVEANRRVFSLGRQLGPEKFLVVNFDALCADPAAHVPEIAAFLKVDPSPEAMAKAMKLPEVPRSAGRYKEHPLSQFRDDDLRFLKDAGFEY